jgi:antitoxin component of MazEF toxin-antitoxin module
MAEIRNINVANNEILINLRVSKQEYDLLKQNTDNLILLPSNRVALNQTLTTGRLGNSNRVMLPKKLLEMGGVNILQKKVPARIFKINGEVFLLVKLEESKTGMPVFEEDVK